MRSIDTRRVAWFVAVPLLVAVAAVLVVAAVLPAQQPDARSAGGEQVFVTQGCYGCHQIGKFGTPIGPDLSHLGAKYPVTYLRRWLRDPESVRPTAHMPKLELSADEIESLAAYLGSLS